MDFCLLRQINDPVQSERNASSGGKGVVQGFVTEGEHVMAGKMAQAIANAVVDEIQANAKAVIDSGSSSGNWPVQ